MSAAMEVDTQNFEQTSIVIRNEAQAIQIVDQDTYDRAAEKFLAAAAMEKQIKDYHAPLKQKAHDAHKAICNAENGLLKPVQEAKQILSRLIGAWDDEQERLRKQEQARLEAEARKRADEEALAAAVEIEELGASEEEVETVLSSPVNTMKVQAAPTYRRAAGVGVTKYWSAELVSLSLLVKAAAENPAYLPYLQANMTALNAAARSQKSLFNVPGVKATDEPRAGSRGR